MFNVKLGKLIVKEVLKNTSESRSVSYSEVLENTLKYANISYSDEYFATIGDSLLEDSELFNEVMNNLDINISFDYSKIDVNDNFFNDTVSKLNKLVLNVVKDTVEENKKSYEHYGKLAYNHFCVNTDEYQGVSSEDMSYLKNNPIDIWNCIPDDKKDIVKVYLMNREYFADDDETCSEVWDAIQDSIDSIVTNDLKYTYLADGKWCKLSKIGSFVWNIAMRYDSMFANVAEKFSKEEDFNLYMELLGKNIPDNMPFKHGKEQITRHQIFNFLNNVLNSNVNCDIDSFSKNDWDNINWNATKRSTEIYETMLMATNKLFEEHLSHLVKWDKDELVWKLLENDVDYYIGLTERALEDDLKYQVFESDEGEHDILEIVFENVKDYKGYQPTILIWYDYIGDISCRSTGVLSEMVSMHEEGYSCGLDIAYEGEACSYRTNLVMENILKMISRKGFNYKMKEAEIVDENKDELENEKNPYFTPIDNETIEISYSSKFKIVKMIDNGNDKLFKFSCDIPGVNNKGELELVKNLIVRYNDSYSCPSVVIENPINRYIGIDRKSLIKKISWMCSTYIRNLKTELEVF